MTSISIALVHNNETDRLSKVRPSIEALSTCLESVYPVKKIEAAYQPAVTPHGSLTAFFRDAIYRQLSREWSAYKELKKIWFTYDWLSFLKSCFKKYVLKNQLSIWQRKSAIETYVTAKHIRSWEIFLESDTDYLLVFEDDVHFKSNSIIRFCDEVIPTLLDHSDCPYVYIDLAGGCSYKELQLQNLEAEIVPPGKRFRKPVTNTACCYLISKDLAKHFIDTLTARPLLRLVGIDWLMNKCFIELGEKAPAVLCVHSSPTIFEHGSVTGHFVSWQQ